MRHAVLGGGKRLRPGLVFLTAASIGSLTALTDAAAVAVELVHCYSLVHDDLPAMDDDDLRRGQPTVHKAHGEATAILTGDALQALAFSVLADPALVAPAPARLRMIHALAEAAGPDGMVGGQALDLAATGSALPVTALEGMHRLKTGALIRASVCLGALSSSLASPPAEGVLSTLDEYAQALGLAFQIRDDILDVTTDTGQLGKQQGADARLEKPTYVSVLGLEGARKALRDAHEAARRALLRLPGDHGRLLALADHFVARNH